MERLKIKSSAAAFSSSWWPLVVVTLIMMKPMDVTSFSLKIPEDVVQMQLAALQKNDIQKAYLYNSEDNQGVMGSWQEFGELLKSVRSFRPILGHSQGHVLLTISHGEDSEYVNCLVKIISNKEDDDENDDEDDDKDDIQKDGENHFDDDDGSDDEDYAPPEESLGTTKESCLYWWEVSKHLIDEENGSGYRYMVDSITTDGDDTELGEMPIFFIDDDDEFDDDEDDDPIFFLDM
jgi:hypothetical protein